MLPLKLLITLLSLSIISCAGLPERPNPEICVVDYPALVGYCGHPDPSKFKTAADLKYDNVIKEVMASKDVEAKPLSYLNKAVCQTPPNWEITQNYVDDLVVYAHNNCH